MHPLIGLWFAAIAFALTLAGGKANQFLITHFFESVTPPASQSAPERPGIVLNG